MDDELKRGLKIIAIVLFLAIVGTIIAFAAINAALGGTLQSIKNETSKIQSETIVVAPPTPTPTPTPVIATQQQMSYADWQKQEAARVKAERDRKAFEESNASCCYTDSVTRNGMEYHLSSDDTGIKNGEMNCFNTSFGRTCAKVVQAKTICTGKRNGVNFIEVQSVVRWDSAGNEIENVTFVRG